MSATCPISGKPVAVRNPELYGVLSQSGEPVHFCCPSHKTKYIAENPRSREVMFVRGNPIVQPSSDIQAWVNVEEQDDTRSNTRAFATVYIWDNSVSSAAEKLVASMVAFLSNNSDKWVVLSAVAAKGYGPLLYDVMSTYLDESLYPSRARSKRAHAFWAKQKDEKIDPLSREEFIKKYGRSINSILAEKEPSAKMMQVFDDTAAEVVTLSQEAEEFGITMGLPYETRAAENPKSMPQFVQLEEVLVSLLPWSESVSGEHNEIDPAVRIRELINQRRADMNNSRSTSGSGLSSSLLTSYENTLEQLRRNRTVRLNNKKYSLIVRPRTLSYLRDMRQKGSVFVVTSLPESDAKEILRMAQLSEEIAGVVTQENVSSVNQSRIAVVASNTVPAVSRILGQLRENAKSFSTTIVPRHSVTNNHPIASSHVAQMR